MMRRNYKKIYVGSISFFMLMSAMISPSYAEEATLQPKSLALVTALALDPFPGDALYYSGKPVQGTINLLFGTLGSVMFYTSLIDRLNRETCASGDDFCRMGQGFGDFLGLTGLVIYVPMLFWDGVGGISSVKEHNKRVKAQRSWNLSPTLDINHEGAVVGLRGSF